MISVMTKMCNSNNLCGISTRTQEMRAEKDPTNKVFPNDSSSIEGRRQKVHDKPFYDSARSRLLMYWSPYWHKVGKSLRLQPMTSTKPCPCCLMYRSTHVQATPMNQFTLPYHKMRKMQVFF